MQLRSWPYVTPIWSPVAAVLPSRAASASTAAGALHHLLGAAHKLVELVHGLVVVADAAEAQKDRIGGPQLGEELAATFTAGWTVAPPGMVVVPKRAIASCIASPQAVARMPSSPSTQQVIASPEKEMTSPPNRSSSSMTAWKTRTMFEVSSSSPRCRPATAQTRGPGRMG